MRHNAGHSKVGVQNWEIESTLFKNGPCRKVDQQFMKSLSRSVQHEMYMPQQSICKLLPGCVLLNVEQRNNDYEVTRFGFNLHNSTSK